MRPVPPQRRVVILAVDRAQSLDIPGPVEVGGRASARPPTASASALRRDPDEAKELSMQIAIPLFDDLTALDAIGPYEVLSRLPGADVVFVGAEARPYASDNGMLRMHFSLP